jgi:hypothetical protein
MHSVAVLNKSFHSLYIIYFYIIMFVAFYLRRAIHNYLIFFTIKKRLSCV